MEEHLELVPRDRDKDICIMFPLILLPIEADSIPEEGCGKENPSRLRSSNSSNIVLILLTEVIAVHVGLSVVYVWETGLQLLSKYLGDDKSWGGSKSGSLSL